MASNSSKVRNAYNYKTYDRVTIQMPKGTHEQIKALAAADGVSVNRYILDALEQKTGLKLTLDNTLPWLRK